MAGLGAAGERMVMTVLEKEAPEKYACKKRMDQRPSDFECERMFQ